MDPNNLLFIMSENPRGWNKDGSRRKLRKEALTEEEKKIRHAETNLKHYHKHKEKINLQRSLKHKESVDKKPNIEKAKI